MQGSITSAANVCILLPEQGQVVSVIGGDDSDRGDGDLAAFLGLFGFDLPRLRNRNTIVSVALLCYQ